jgi:uncharacterized protein (DUF362 family)
VLSLAIEANNAINTEVQSEAFFFHILNSQAIVWLLSMNSWGKKEWRFTQSGAFLLGATSLVWFLFRTGTKPTRIVYPCQRIAVNTLSTATHTLLPAALTSLFIGFSFRPIKMLAIQAKTTVKRYWKPIVALAIILPTAGLGLFFVWTSLQPNPPGSDVNLILTPQTATSSPASDIFVLKGPTFAHITNLINLMGSHGLDFYQSSTTGTNQGPSGLIANNDVVLIKINSQWAERGGTNTDLLREMIQAVLDHPDGFNGEIVIADNGQGYGSLDWDESNAEDPGQSVSDIVTSFSATNPVNMFDWQAIRGNEVEEYSDGDMNDGYILYDVADPDTGVYVTYPKFQTTDGTNISFKHGVWSGSTYENRLKVINFPILKSHFNYGVTGATKHYMGVESEGTANPGGLANGHWCIRNGGMGTLLAETRYPVINILDATWVNANPAPSFHCGPSTAYEEATRVNVLMASTDPIALDYWAAKQVLMQTAELNGLYPVSSLDPDNTQRAGLAEAFGVWLRLTETELIQNGYTVTCDEARMNVYISQPFRFPIDLPSFVMICPAEIPGTSGTKKS